MSEEPLDVASESDIFDVADLQEQASVQKVFQSEMLMSEVPSKVGGDIKNKN